MFITLNDAYFLILLVVTTANIATMVKLCVESEEANPKIDFSCLVVGSKEWEKAFKKLLQEPYTIDVRWVRPACNSTILTLIVLLYLYFSVSGG